MRFLSLSLSSLSFSFLTFHAGVGFCFSRPLPFDIDGDALSDGQLAGALADFRQVGAGEAVEDLGQVGEIHFLVDGRLAQASPEDGESGRLVGQRDVDQLIQTAGTKDGRIDNVRSEDEKGDGRRNMISAS